VANDSTLENDPLWFKDAVIYEVHVKTFFDSDGDGIGDFKGLIEKLDYLRDLGVTALWLLPFYPSPMKDDGYDIADYSGVHPTFGSVRDFKVLLREAHRKGIRVITELVLNHTSVEHPWFKKSRRAPKDSEWRNFYVWNDSPDKYKDARIIFKDFESSNWAWDPVAKSYYWHRFYSMQPDLNFNSPLVEKAIFNVVDFWFKLGVDGMRLDAVPYLFEREDTNCENLPETHAFLKKLRARIDKKFPNRMLLAEANQWPTDAVNYFGKGDECHMAFHFPLMTRMFMSVQMEDRFPLMEIIRHTPIIPDTCQWAVFLRNHDELTLEMVTDEERDYMYSMYAKDRKARINLGIRRRLAPLLENDRRKIELMNVLLFTLPGTPVIYYGDEIGMGDNYFLGDRDGVRTPMQWNADTNAGFSKANPQQVYLPPIIDPEYHYQTINVSNQSHHQNLLWWMKKMISIRKRFKAFGRGSLRFLQNVNPKILAFVREIDGERLLVTVNLSRQPQTASLDLSPYVQGIPREAFGSIEFPAIEKTPYPLTFGPFGYYLFVLENPDVKSTSTPAKKIVLPTEQSLWKPTRGALKQKLEENVLRDFLKKCRWFGGKGRKIDYVDVREAIPIGKIKKGIQGILVLDVNYVEGAPETYLLPAAFAREEKAKALGEQHPESVIAHIKAGKEEGILFDALYDEAFCRELLKLVSKNRGEIGLGSRGRMDGFSPMSLKSLDALSPELQPSVLSADQSNTSVVYGNKLIIKFIRKTSHGPNPELEITRWLTKNRFAYSPALLGGIVYRERNLEDATVAVLQPFIKNQGSAWKLFSDEFNHFMDRVLPQKTQMEQKEQHAPSSDNKLSGDIKTLVGPVFLEQVKLLGERTGQFHLALTSDGEDADLAPEPFGHWDSLSISQSMITYADRVFELVNTASPQDEKTAKELKWVLENQQEVLRRFEAIRGKKFVALKTRIHGDYHLGQVLFTGNDYVIIDFEGEPARPLGERRLKRSPLRDVAGMIRSFHYVAYSMLQSNLSLKMEDRAFAEQWTEQWFQSVKQAFLESYEKTVARTDIVPKDKNTYRLLLDSFLLEKAIYELGYELNNRPEWVLVPVRGIQAILGKPYESAEKKEERK